MKGNKLKDDNISTYMLKVDRETFKKFKEICKNKRGTMMQRLNKYINKFVEKNTVENTPDKVPTNLNVPEKWSKEHLDNPHDYVTGVMEMQNDITDCLNAQAHINEYLSKKKLKTDGDE